MSAQQPNVGARKWFGHKARRYDKMRIGRPGLIEDFRIVDAFLDTCEPGSTVADIAAGTGRAVRAVLDRGLHYIGGDISADMIAICQQKIAGDPRAKTFVSDARSTPLPDGAADYLISVRFLKWLQTNEMVLDALREFRRICRIRALINVKIPVEGKHQRELLSRFAYALKNRTLVRRPRSSSIAPSEFEALCSQANWTVIKQINNTVTKGSRFYLLDAH
jgi:ubiquinone/menaquinone biosynthesis C-methylase UbiE